MCLFHFDVNWSMYSPFFGSMLNFFRPIDICLFLLECLQSSCESSASISATTSHSSSLICCKTGGEMERKRNEFFKDMLH